MTAHIISVLNMKGGVGKTTITTNLAVELYNRGRKVLVIDVDPQFNSTQTLMKFYEGGLDQYFQLQEDDRVLTRIFTSSNRNRGLATSDTKEFAHKSNNVIHNLSSNNELGSRLDIIPGDMRLIIDINDAASDKFRSFVKKENLRDNYDFVLIDCPPTWGQLTSVALSTSDYYLIPTNLDEFSTIGITLLAELLSDKVDSVDQSLKNLGVVYMFLKQNAAMDGIARSQKPFRTEIEDYLKNKMKDLVKSDVKPFETVFYDDSYFITQSALYFTTLAEEHRIDYKNKVKDLVDEILDRLKILDSEGD